MPYASVRKRIGRPRLICGLICLLAIHVAGCAESPAPPEPVGITFVHLDVDTPYYAPLVRRFGEIYPHIIVELRPKSWQLLASSSVADDVDVSVFLPAAMCRLYPGRCSASPDELLEEGRVLGLSPFIAQDQSFDLSGIFPGTVDLYTVGGETLAIPVGMDPMVMYYNVDLFDQYGVPYPESGWTWDDFLNVALAIRDPEANVFGYAPRNQVLDPLQFVYQHGGRIADDLQHPTTATLDDPLTVEAIEWYADLFDEHNIAPTPEEAMDEGFGGTMETGIYLNRVGMWMGWFSERGGRSAGSPGTWKMRWDMVPLPRDTQSIATARVGGYFISSQARYPDAC